MFPPLDFETGTLREHAAGLASVQTDIVNT
jgi:hypothetical protein